MPDESDVTINKEKKKHRKKGNSLKTRVNRIVLQTREKRRKEKKKIQNDKLMTEILGDVKAVEEKYEGGRRSYFYKCPECDIVIRDKLSRHLVKIHKFEINEAHMKQSEVRVMFLWIRSEKHNCPLPVPCEQCNEWFLRLDHHLRHHKKHLITDEDELSKLIDAAKNKFWGRGISTNKPRQRLVCDTEIKKSTTSETCNVNESESSESEDEGFVYRSKAAPLESCDPNLDYIPKNALHLTDDLRKKWQVKDDDFFTIYYRQVEMLLEAFFNDLASAAMERDTAMAHKNKVELILTAINKRENMQMFPVNPLSNLHLLRDYYHRPTFRMIGNKGGVQASTLRSRFVSMNFFIQFLRKQQIFAGMSRIQLSYLEDTISDFNKELNPLIKQRKIDVRREKVRNLLTPTHFINYGRSSCIQGLLEVYNRFKKAPKSTATKLTRKFATQFRDYIITSMCIGNGLRASNIMHLRLRDFNEFKTIADYPGHKIVTNSTYKTSTIYGEKFIVIPDQLFDHYLFYVDRLRPKLSFVKSKCAFVPLSCNSGKFNQTHVSSSLTASFKLANVFRKNEKPRVSCTRIRCGIATYACNEGGFDSAFFAKHFMKNREETTNIHYNLLSNRRHALNIAMKLYHDFSDKNCGINISMEDADVAAITSVVKDTVRLLPSKDKVIEWMKTRNPDISKKELGDICEILEELNEGAIVSSNRKTFYGHIEVGQSLYIIYILKMI